jgi:dTDP-4-amino-4,6-dideoxygalactose transaminase
MSKLAMLGGEKAAAGLAESRPTWPPFDGTDLAVVTEAMRSGPWCRISGEEGGGEGALFERQFADYHDTKHGLVVANGTVAIELGLRACGVRPGDEVIVPALTFIASASAIACVGAVPIFVDSDPNTLQLDVKGVEAAITKRTTAVVAVHYGGYPVDLDALVPLCKKRKLLLIEDCAHAQGSQWRGQGVGSFGQMGCFSLQESKAITSGEGGIVMTNDDETAERALLLRNIGRSDRGYGHVALASNLRLPGVCQALLWSAFRHLPPQVERKDANGRALAEALRQVGGLEPLKADERVTRRGYYFMVLKYQAEQFGGLPRDKFTAALRAEGVPGLGHAYGIPLYRNDCFRKGEIERLLPPKRLGPLPDYDALNLPVVEKFCAEQQITMSHQMLLAPQRHLLKIADAVAKIKEHAAELMD